MFYDSAGRERERRQGNGLIYHYDELVQLASHQIYRGFDVELNDTPLPVWQQQYQYAPDGQLAQINGNQARHYRYEVNCKRLAIRKRIAKSIMRKK